MSFLLVTPFQIVFVGKSLGEALAQVQRVTLWESIGRVRPLGVCVGGASITEGTPWVCSDSHGLTSGGLPSVFLHSGTS